MRDIISNGELLFGSAERRELLAEAERLIRQLEQQPALYVRREEEYYTLWATSRIDAAEISQAAAGMRDKEAFLDFPAYLRM